jgi:hypothetical protein
MSTTALYARKEVAALPVTLIANTIYAVRRSTGFDLHITDSSGLIAHKLNNSDDPLKSPTFTYTSGKLTGISYSDGATKVLSYVGDNLTRVDLIRNSVTTRKDFTYSGGVLVNVIESTV